MIHITGHIQDKCVQHTVTKHYTFVSLFLGVVSCVSVGGCPKCTKVFCMYLSWQLTPVLFCLWKDSRKHCLQQNYI